MSVLKDSLHAALVALTGHEHAKQRLTTAWVAHLFDLNAEELPDGFRQRFMAMRDSLTSRTASNAEHPVIPTIRKMSQVDAATHARDILVMYEKLLNDELPRQLRLVDSNEADDTAEPVAVPDFLTHH